MKMKEASQRIEKKSEVREVYTSKALLNYFVAETSCARLLFLST